MLSTRRNQRKALKALALGVATAAIFATSASAQVRSEAASASDVSYLSWGATADDLGPFTASLANQSTRDGGPVFMNGVPDGYVGSGVAQANSSGEGVTPTNLARAYQPIEQGVAQPDGYQPQLQGNEQLVIRGKPDGFQPQTKTVESAAVSSGSDSFDRGDLALGFGLGLILATACAIAVAMTRDRQRTRMAHS
jgi:hypothetical protein